MDKKALQILLAEDNPADIAIIREVLKYHHVATTLDLRIVDRRVCRGTTGMIF